EVARIIREVRPDMQVELGHRCGGQLNFPRRIVNTVLTAATKHRYGEFVQAVEQALSSRRIQAEVMILKADGGTLPLSESLDTPVETIFSGPAASVLGALSLTEAGQTGVVVDIGGTTTDLALILSGQPLMAAKGVAIKGQLTQVRSFAINALPLGGDSRVVVEAGRLVIKPERQGPAACLGGPSPTPTDALRLLNRVELGSYELAAAALKPLADQLGVTLLEVAEQILMAAARIVEDGINAMYQAWQQEPAYHIWKLVQKRSQAIDTIIGVGGGAAGLIQPVADALGCRLVLSELGAVANAVGAAVAQPTVRISLRADTEQGKYQLEEDGVQRAIPGHTSISQAEVVQIGEQCLQERAQKLGLDPLPEKSEQIYHEVFNVVRGSRTVGAIHYLVLETPWRISHYVGGEQA
ncbi:MAG TPA: hydantoinase/oxoprolinase family protein, partial [Bacillota bacterium]|nr:hydantoinase/oxoprolinase family protein [Bacillota bacterium]